jgi:hypothetical protein
MKIAMKGERNRTVQEIKLERWLIVDKKCIK